MIRPLTLRQRISAAVAAAGILALPGSAGLGPDLAVSALTSAVAGPQYEGESYYVDTLWPGTVVTTSITGTADPAAAKPGPYGLTTPSALTSSGIPAAAYRAYVNAAAQLARADPSCGLHWSVLAGIGRVESNHGRFGGSTIGANGVVAPPIIGIRLDGSRAGTARIGDSDRGRYDGDPLFDRAVGPMQFLPGTWEQFAPGADPQDMNAAALAAGGYLCQGSALLATPAGRWAAVFRYNHSDSYVSLVLSLADSYASGTVATFPSRPAGTPALPAQAPSATTPGPPPSVPIPPVPIPPVPITSVPTPPVPVPSVVPVTPIPSSGTPVPSGTATPSPTAGDPATSPSPTAPPEPSTTTAPSVSVTEDPAPGSGTAPPDLPSASPAATGVPTALIIPPASSTP